MFCCCLYRLLYLLYSSFTAIYLSVYKSIYISINFIKNSVELFSASPPFKNKAVSAASPGQITAVPPLVVFLSRCRKSSHRRLLFEDTHSECSQGTIVDYHSINPRVLASLNSPSETFPPGSRTCGGTEVKRLHRLHLDSVRGL